MRYADIYTDDFSNGEGRRLTLFVTGCSHGCPGCHNRAAQNPKYGNEYTEDTKYTLLAMLENHTGLTLTGGDPLFKRNIAELTELARDAKELYPYKDIWLWTGYTHSEVADLEILQYVDVLVDGKYEESRPPAPWRGSDNQQLIYLKELQ